ncbi:alpha/beta fold hydrolase [Salinibacterium sp. ZJ70]|uniref:alpha/beta fold hydrolase n=1 Tax=Salinibacterium sp. ZJ70 TaxID=2708084 RepID=UPI00141F719B|nr:alpha/beta hydrolase [Salinibacterium sp. ZJ70]
MHVAASGPTTAPTVLLLHGGGVGGWMWRPLLGELGDDVHALVPDLPGHDGSASESYLGHTATIDALIRMLDEHGARSRVTVVGFSLGAQLATMLASTEPLRIAHAVIVSAQAEPLRFAGATLALLRYMAPLARNARFARAQAAELRVPESLMTDYVRTSATMSADDMVASVGENLRFTVPERWSRFPGRADVVVGERERALMRRSAAALHEALPSSRLTTFEGVGHAIPFERPRELANLIRAGLPTP